MTTDQHTLGQSDASLAVAIQGAAAELLVVANGFTALVAARADSGRPWQPIGRGDFGPECGKAVKARVKAGHLWWQDVTGSPAAFDLANAAPHQAQQAQVQQWLKDAQSLTGRERR
jgi:hypothetical protein